MPWSATGQPSHAWWEVKGLPFLPLAPVLLQNCLPSPWWVCGWRTVHPGPPSVSRSPASPRKASRMSCLSSPRCWSQTGRLPSSGCYGICLSGGWDQISKCFNTVSLTGRHVLVTERNNKVPLKCGESWRSRLLDTQQAALSACSRYPEKSPFWADDRHIFLSKKCCPLHSPSEIMHADFFFGFCLHCVPLCWGKQYVL